MWNRGLGKCPSHGENQKHFGPALTEMTMIETPILTLRHITWFISTSAPYHLTLSFTLSMTPSLSARMTDLFSASSSLCLCFHLPHSGCAVQHFDSEVCWTIHNPWLIQHSLPITFVHSWQTGSSFTPSTISFSQMPLLTVKCMQISPVPHHKTQKLLPLLTCLNTQDLTC